MRIRWTPAAAADLEQISDYLKEHNPRLRQQTMLKLYEEIRALTEWPHRGRVGNQEGTRQLSFSPLPYVAIYRVTETHVEVIRVYHAARDWL